MQGPIEVILYDDFLLQSLCPLTGHQTAIITSHQNGQQAFKLTHKSSQQNTRNEILVDAFSRSCVGCKICCPKICLSGPYFLELFMDSLMVFLVSGGMSQGLSRPFPLKIFDEKFSPNSASRECISSNKTDLSIRQIKYLEKNFKSIFC